MGGLNLSRVNYGVIILLPKIKEVVNIKQYRPIYLLNVFYKIFTKVLSIRLLEVAAETIRKTQTAFIKGRNILEGVVTLYEVIHELKTKQQEGIILMLDFEKSYGKVNWEFLKEVLVQKGFPRKWIDWIMQTVEGGKVCININNEQGEILRTFKGLR
jgi:hypothetical protein